MLLQSSVFLALLIIQDPPVSLAGYWTNQTASVVIALTPCSDAGWCGTVVWASEQAAADARRGGTASLLKTELLHGFAAFAPNRWKGRIFVPDLGKTSSAELRQLDADRLMIRGCTIGGLICRSQVWTRTNAPTR